MIELTLSEGQLKAAVTAGSEESATREIAERLLTVALGFCLDVVPQIRAAIEEETPQVLWRRIR